eukprot:jgi/Tetstr1/426300/TSEL_016616.t1
MAAIWNDLLLIVMQFQGHERDDGVYTSLTTTWIMYTSLLTRVRGSISGAMSLRVSARQGWRRTALQLLVLQLMDAVALRSVPNGHPALPAFGPGAVVMVPGWRPVAPVTRFVVVGGQRTSSSFLIKCLGAHPDVLAHGEIAIGRVHKGMEAELNLPDKIGRNLTVGDRMALIEAMWAHPHDALAVGFKLQAGQLPASKVDAHLLQDWTVKKIVLYRRDVVARTVSLMAAKQTGNFHSGRTHQLRDLRIDIAAAVRSATEYVRWYRFIHRRLRSQAYFLISSEEVNERPAESLEQIAVWLGLRNNSKKMHIKAVKFPFSKA